MVTNRHTFADAAFVFLRECKEELHYKELARRVLEARYFVSRGKTPGQTLRSQISREIKQAGEDARFVNHDGGIIAISDRGRDADARELEEFVREFSTRPEKKAPAKKAAKKGAKKPAKKTAKKAAAAKDAAPKDPPESEAGGDVAAPGDAAPVDDAMNAEGAGAPAAVEVSAEAPAAAPPAPHGAPVAEAGPRGSSASATAPVPPAAAAPEPAGEAGEAGGRGAAFIPVDLGEPDFDDDEDDVGDGTFASSERDVALLDDDPDDDDADTAATRTGTAKVSLDEDSEQDFLSVGRDLREMKSTEYNASMDELAPIVVPPHEGGAAEIARLPMGGRSVLILKVVRRQGRPQVQLVEELESLISGVVGRMLLTLPGEDLPDLLEALMTTKKVIAQSFVPGEEPADEPVYLD